MTRTIFSRRSAFTVAFTVGALFLGVAFAVWTSSGSGSGSAKALQAVRSTVSAATATSDLYPGFTAGDVFFEIDNPNPYPVRFTSMTPTTVTSSDPSACPASNVTVASASGLSIDVPESTTTPAPRTIPNVVSMGVAAPNGCQGVSFTVAVDLSGIQQ